MSFAYAFAILLPICVGVAMYAACLGIAKPSERAAALGYGALFGLLLTAAATALSARTATAQAWRHAAPWLVLMLMIALVYAWRRRRLVTIRAVEPPEPTRPWQRTLLVFLCGTLAMRGVLAAREIWLRPLYPWDAWSAWAVKSKVWYSLGHHVDYAASSAWAEGTSQNLYTAFAWFYPDALAWLDVWFASATGGWVEPLINLPWLIVWMSLLVGHYGQWRMLGLCRVRALFFIYALGSLPLLTVHAALAGYADLWIAAALGFGVLSWMRWLQQRERAQLVLALLCAVTLPFIKIEGWVWMCGLLAAIGFGALPAPWRIRAVLAAAAMGLLLSLGVVRFAFTKLGWIDAHGALLDPRVGAFALLLNLHWHGVAALGVLDALYAHPNWHLLWWLLPGIVAWRRRELVARQALWLPALFLLACVAAIVFLFTCTEAADWAQSFTAINRLVLQLTPAIISLSAMLLRDARLPERPSDIAPIRAVQNDPA
jgi:hypothetical protein